MGYKNKMVTRILIYIVFGSSLIGCCRQFQNLGVYSTEKGKAVKIVCIAEEGNSTWCWLDSSNQLHVLKNQPEVFNQIEETAVSPEHRYIAIVSSGEGHPVLDIFETRLFFENQSDQEPLKPFATIDPYPGILESVQWKSESCIQFISDVDFSHFDPTTKRSTNGNISNLTSWRFDIVRKEFLRFN